MDRRKFLQNLAATTAALQDLVNNASAADFAKRSAVPDPQPSVHRGEVDIEGYMLVSQFKIGPTVWKVYEDLRRSEEHTSELQSRFDLVCRLLLENKNLSGVQKKQYRNQNFRRDKIGKPAQVAAIDHDANRNASQALLHYADFVRLANIQSICHQL